ncbi:unnamed protein product [Diabrotica balteata]|uniref:Uncharacterized protein n=1 Tax=Diabrotica balteata TaxID=107213 RepID=A0A9N9SUG0_DIABA|nr:unnamed protein product [Diabrotica balteata]
MMSKWPRGSFLCSLVKLQTETCLQQKDTAHQPGTSNEIVEERSNISNLNGTGGVTSDENDDVHAVFDDSLCDRDINSGNSSFQQRTADHIFEQKREIVKRKVFELKEKTSKIRPRNPDGWKKRTAAIARERGEEYSSQTGKIVAKKEASIGLLCKEKCRLNCRVKFDTEARKAILQKYYSLVCNAKNALLFKSQFIKPVARHMTNIKKAKMYSFTYSVTFNKKTEVICRDALCSLYQIGANRIELLQQTLKKGLNAPSPDSRDHHTNRHHKLKEEVVTFIVEHIKKFPAEQSHYSRNKNEHKNISRLS